MVRLFILHHNQIVSSILENVEIRKKYLIINQRYQEAFIEHVPSLNQRCRFSSLFPFQMQTLTIFVFAHTIHLYMGMSFANGFPPSFYPLFPQI